MVVVELLLVLPAVVFMGALFLRNIQPAPYQPAAFARGIVDWYGARPLLGLDVFLIALPLLAFVVGCTTVIRGWRPEGEMRRAAVETLAATRTHLPALLIFAVTVAAGGILVVVGMHMITE